MTRSRRPRLRRQPVPAYDQDAVKGGARAILKTRRFTVDEYYRMAEAGILGEDDRVELLKGEIVEMSPIGKEHAACVNRLNDLLHRLCGSRAHVRIRSPVRLDRFGEPRPDVALVHPRADYYAAGHPEPADVLLLIEVADTSLV